MPALSRHPDILLELRDAEDALITIWLYHISWWAGLDLLQYIPISVPGGQVAR